MNFILAFIAYMILSGVTIVGFDLDVGSIENAFVRRTILLLILPAEIACGLILTIGDWIGGATGCKLLNDWLDLLENVLEAWDGR